MQSFKNVSLDSFTYDQLTTLSRAARLTRTEYLRHLIRDRVSKDNVQTPPKSIIKHGAKISISELDPIERTVSLIGEKFGVNVDIPFLRFVYDLATGKQKPEDQES